MTMDIDGVVTAFDRPAAIVDPDADNRRWSVATGQFAFQLETAKLSTAPGTKDVVLVPGVYVSLSPPSPPQVLSSSSSCPDL